MFRRRILVAGIGAFLSCHIASEARVAFVDGRRPDCGDGFSWSTAYAHLQDALAAARNSDNGITEIWVAAGTYCPDRDCAHPTGSGDREARFQLVDGVAMYGGFAGDEDPGGFSIADRDLSLNATRLSGDLAKNDGAQWTNRNENSYCVVEARGVGLATILDGFVISGAESSSGRERPISGLYVVIASPVLTRCTFESNRAGSGGGMYHLSGAPALDRCVFESNAALGGGGGSLIGDGNPRLVNCVFRHNEAGYNGGGITSIGVPTLVGCTFVGNRAGNASKGYGGAVYCGDGLPSFVNCTLIDNAALTGSAVYSGSGNPNLTNCVVWGNVALPGSSVTGAAAVMGMVKVTYSCIQGGLLGTGNISTDPRLVLVNGEVIGLRHGSPCIDAGDNTALPTGVAVDVAGSPRFVDDPAAPNTGPQGIPPSTAIDMGAYEYQLRPAGPLYVKAGGGVGGDGRSWSTPFEHLQDALAAAAVDPGVSEIWVAAGAFPPDRDASHPTGTSDRTSSFRLLSGVALYGGFPGEPGQEGDLTVRAPAAYETILSGDLAGDDGAAWSHRGDNSFHVVTAGGAGSVCVLDGFTVSGGNASGNSPDNSGGGMLVSVGSCLQGMNCRFRENTAAGRGGGLYDDGAISVLIDCVFDSNRAAVDGAGVAAIKSNPTLTRCTFSANTGTGLTVSQGAPIVTACTFSGNSGAGLNLSGLAGSSVTYCELRGNKGSGAICNGPVTIDHCAMTGNVSANGGGMCINSGDPILTNCLFEGNSGSSGGGLYVGACSPTLTRCTFRGNAGNYGGGLYLDGGGSSLTNCVFVDNAANCGGGLYGKSVTGTQGNVFVTSCTLVANRSSESQTGGGVHSAGTPVYLTDCILWSNSPVQIHQGSGLVSARYCCIQNGPIGEGNIYHCPGPAFTSGGSLRLQRGSACIDAGSSSASPTAAATDANGDPRFVDDPDIPNPDRLGGAPRAVIDMGAYEYQPGPIGRLYVKAGAAPGGDGRSWSTAYAFLQDALALATLDPAGAEIWVAAGVYKPDRDAEHPSGTGDRAVSFKVWGHTPLYGGFPGLPGQEDDLSVRRPARYVTVLSGDLSGNDSADSASREENSNHVVTIEGVGPVSTLDGFTISGGNAERWLNGEYSLYGGGLLTRGGGPTVAHCVFAANSAQVGGGVGAYESSLSFKGCLFSGNSAVDKGGGAYLLGGKLSFVNCTFGGNSAPNGGGIGYEFAFGDPALVITNSVLWGNPSPQIYGRCKVTYSCVQEAKLGVGNIKTDPLFVGSGDYRLQPGSPCIDSGSNVAVPSDILFDLDGHARRMDDPASADCLIAPGTCGQRPIVDMGAYEYIAGDFDRDSDIDAEDLAVFLTCMTGEAIPAVNDCGWADLDHDGDVDQSDFGNFQRCHSGPGTDVDPACTGG